MRKVFTNILDDPHHQKKYLIIDALYKRMLDMLDRVYLKTAKLYKSVLAIVLAVDRPITFDELTSFMHMPSKF